MAESVYSVFIWPLAHIVCTCEYNYCTGIIQWHRHSVTMKLHVTMLEWIMYRSMYVGIVLLWVFACMLGMLNSTVIDVIELLLDCTLHDYSCLIQGDLLDLVCEIQGWWRHTVAKSRGWITLLHTCTVCGYRFAFLDFARDVRLTQLDVHAFWHPANISTSEL